MKKNKTLILLFALLFSIDSVAETSTDKKLATSNQDTIDPSRLHSFAQLQVLNKTTAKTSNLEIKIGEKAKFGSINITAKKCWKASLDQKPESKILIEVSEIKTSDKEEEKEENKIFYGWLFASSPSVSGLEHPIYDIVAIDCKNK